MTTKLAHDIVSEIQLAMRMQGISATDMSSKSGLPYRTVQRVLGNEHEPTLAVLEKILSVLDCELTVQRTND